MPDRLEANRLYWRRQHQKAAALRPKTFIIEGTNVKRKANVTEREVYEHALKAISGSKHLVIADFSPRDIYRLLTFLKIARETGRMLAILPKDAYLLKAMRLLNPGIPDIAEDAWLFIYQDTISSRAPNLWVRNICQNYDSKIVLADDVRAG